MNTTILISGIFLAAVGVYYKAPPLAKSAALLAGAVIILARLMTIPAQKVRTVYKWPP